MSRYVSFGVLIAVILFLGILLYRVMAAFVLPLFLATVLVVVFSPVHRWVVEKTNRRKTLASALTTAIISLAVIVPVGGIGLFAFLEARDVFKDLSSGGIEQNLKRIRKSLDLEIPASAEFQELETEVRGLDVRNWDEMKIAEKQLDRIDEAADRLELGLKIRLRASGSLGPPEQPLVGPSEIELWDKFRNSVRNTREFQVRISSLQMMVTNSGIGNSGVEPNPAVEKKQSEPGDRGDDTLRSAQELKDAQSSYKQALADVAVDFDNFRLQTLGGSFNAYLKELANPSPEEAKKYNEAIIRWIGDNFLSLGGKASQFLFDIVFDIVIMMIGVFFFLIDGPKMIAAIKFFSPLDDRHEQQLINEFAVVSRAVMVATLTAAAVQGVLAGIGYYFAGIDAVFLLMMLTGVLAMVPFVGAGAVWVPTCLYLYLIEDRFVPALLLAIWGAGVVSTIDNLIKPYILHGKSNIHPLLALLSVLGGVSTLGPIGIVVGPMVVAFLQTLLTILQREIKELDTTPASEGEGVANLIESVVEQSEADREENSSDEIDKDKKQRSIKKQRSTKKKRTAKENSDEHADE